MKKTIKSVQDILKKLLYILTREQKKYAVLLLIISFFGALLETLGVSAIVPLINAMMTPDVLLGNKLVRSVFEMLHIENSNSIVLIVGIGIIILYLFKNLFFVFMAWARAKYTVKIQRELSVDMMKTYMNKGYLFFLTQNTGELMRGVFNDTSAICNILNYLFKLIVDLLTVILICIYMLIADWVIAATMAGLMGACMIIIYGYFKNKMQKNGQESRKYGAIVNQQAIQAFQGIKEVIVMRKQNFFIRNFEKARYRQGETSVNYSVGAESPAYIIEAICITGLLAIICIRIVSVGGNGEEMFSTLSAFAVGAFRILPALGKICSGYNTIVFYMPSLTHMYNLLQETSVKEEMVTTPLISESTEHNAVRRFKDKLEIQNICWKYTDEAGDVLHDLNMTIRKGESIALIGQSGSGKTTLADIILGLLRPQSGQVLLDGKDIFSFGTEWGKIMGYVPQTVYLSDDSIKKNIAFGVDEKDIDEEKVWRALEQAQLKEVVSKLEQNLETPIGERGVRFSGGQRQRVAIARALYADPDILLLDEATAALDNETESAVMEAIEALQGKLTLIIIAHRLTTVRKCDKIYEVKDGVVVLRDRAEVLADIDLKEATKMTE